MSGGAVGVSHPPTCRPCLWKRTSGTNVDADRAGFVQGGRVVPGRPSAGRRGESERARGFLATWHARFLPETQVRVCEAAVPTARFRTRGRHATQRGRAPPACPCSLGDGAMKGLIKSPPHFHLLTKQHELMKRCEHSDLSWQECLLK